jgi:hypothetical protein
MTTTAPVTRPTTPTHASRLAHGSDLERAYLTFVGAVIAATLIGFLATAFAEHRRRRARQPRSAQADRGVHALWIKPGGSTLTPDPRGCCIVAAPATKRRLPLQLAAEPEQKRRSQQTPPAT